MAAASEREETSTVQHLAADARARGTMKLVAACLPQGDSVAGACFQNFAALRHSAIYGEDAAFHVQAGVFMYDTLVERRAFAVLQFWSGLGSTWPEETQPAPH